MRRGFTLIELLVVIAIIAILAAILFPVFTTAKEQGKVAACSSNLKQIGNAYAMYVDEYNGWYPSGARPLKAGEPLIDPKHQIVSEGVCTWDIAISKYVMNTSVFKCPSDGIKRPNGTLPRSYSLNDQPRVYYDDVQGVDDGKAVPTHAPWNTADMKPNPSRYILLSEIPSSATAQNNFGSWSWSSIGCGNTGGIGAHMGGSLLNYLFFDGHVKGMNPKTANADPKRLWGYLPGKGDDNK